MQEQQAMRAQEHTVAVRRRTSQDDQMVVTKILTFLNESKRRGERLKKEALRHMAHEEFGYFTIKTFNQAYADTFQRKRGRNPGT